MQGVGRQRQGLFQVWSESGVFFPQAVHSVGDLHCELFLANTTRI